jgi:hypothetical protein
MSVGRFQVLRQPTPIVTSCRPDALIVHIFPGKTGKGDLMQAMSEATRNRVYAYSLASVYPHYIAKAEKKGRSKSEVDDVICWLTGYSQPELEAHLEQETNLETFFTEAPQPNPNRTLITGVICGIRVEEIEEPIMREIRYMDKLIDELARGKAMEKILRK